MLGVLLVACGSVLDSRPPSDETLPVDSEATEDSGDTGEIPIMPEPSTVPRTILIVDDEPAIRAALSLYLEREGHTVDAVGSGRWGIQEPVVTKRPCHET